MTQECPIDASPGYRRILVAMDFSASAEAALKQAVWLARDFGSKVTLAHTLPSFRRAVESASYLAKVDLLYGEGSVFHREVRQESEARLQRMIVDQGITDLNVKVETLIGTPYVEITHAVQSEHYDLVLAGTRGLAAWEQFFVGSTAKQLLRMCPSSVWITNAGYAEPPKSVLATTDFSDASRRAVLEGMWVAKQASAQFHLLHVIDALDVPEQILFANEAASSVRHEINEEATRRLEAFVESLNTDCERVQRHLTWGTPWQEVNRLAKHLKVDLITMGTVGRTGIKGAFLGNTAERVLGTCDCGILTAKPEEFVSPVMPAFWALHPGQKQGELDSMAKEPR